MATLSKIEIVNDLKIAFDPEKHLRPAVVALTALVHDRIHVNGLASDGAKIGTYSPEYMAVRTGKFKNADVFKKGEKKGANKNSGSFTKGGADTVEFGKQGFQRKARPNYNRTDDTTVIISLTRQLENDYGVESTGPKSYGIGFKNPHNFDKAGWVEETYNKDIFRPTEEEVDKVTEIIADLITNGQ